ncbi:MAG: response regulator, partial [Nitrospinaceae bacterium]|nr:response regulator [Nitrospinaceae bacterium]NIR55845.1 response regulator [Nitrospinaceae bacterium]NIS86298.1 response regulator [Nitrospinaceae bacterium]NIT83127.1 response regulator [Nitrospinaceae bacterium]NIU45337.1 response regulator [Nitrospinaceae bacterium]
MSSAAHPKIEDLNVLSARLGAPSPSLATLLVVDDSRTQVSFMKNILEKEYEIRTAYNGLEAVEQFRDHRPDLVLLDIEMPHMNGYEACREIKAIGRDTFVPIIFITSKNDLQSLKKGLQIGAEDYLTKPFHPEELRARIQVMLRTKSLYNQLEEANAIIEKERDTIANIQRSLLCDEPPEIEGFRFFTDYQPSSKAGGDYYDFI